MTLSSVLPDTEVAAYEAELADRLAVEHVVAVSSGTAALQCALDAVCVGPGDEVLMPALTVIMSAAPVHHLGATPVFVDCAADGAGLDYDDLAAKITSRTRAIMPVHLWGRADDETVIRAVAAEHGLAVIADACQALGTTIDTDEGTVQAGTPADIGCFSTHRLKLLSTDEGGFLTTNDPDLAVRARAYRSHWQTAAGHHRPMSRLTHNFRLAEPLAQIGRRELRRLNDLIAQRQELTSMTLDLLRDVPHVSAVPQLPGQRWNHYAPLLHLDIEHPRAFAEHLAATGVPNSTGTFRLIPMDQRPMFTRDRPDCVNAAAFLDGILALVLTRDDDMHRIRDYAETITQEVTQWANT